MTSVPDDGSPPPYLDPELFHSLAIYGVSEFTTHTYNFATPDYKRLMLDTFQEDYISLGMACIRTKDKVTAYNLHQIEEEHVYVAGYALGEPRRSTSS